MIGRTGISTYISQAYPPADTQIRDHFLSFKHLPTDDVKQRFMIFFQALFAVVTAGLPTNLPQGESIQSVWYRDLSAGETPLRVGTSRTTLYDQVITHAKSVENTTLLSATNPLMFYSRFT